MYVVRLFEYLFVSWIRMSSRTLLISCPSRLYLFYPTNKYPKMDGKKK